MTREELILMPISQLRGLDIKEKEDEILVQEVLAEKLNNLPHLDPNRVVLPPEATDNLTPKKEMELEAKLNGLTQPIVGEDKTAVIPPPNKFCEFCDAKGPVKHKKNCTKPK